MDFLWKLLFLACCLPVGMFLTGTVIGWGLLIGSANDNHGSVGCALVLVIGLAVGAVGGLLWLAFGGPTPW